MKKILFENLPSKNTPISAENLNLMQDNVEAAIPDISGKQDKLVSGENIKTINGTSILGSGNIVIEGGGSGGSGADDVPINTIVEYDGTTIPDGWEEVEDKPFIQCGITSNVSISTTRVYIVFNNNIQRGDMFSVDADGGVRVNDGVEEGYLKLHFHTNINNTGVTISNIACDIYQNTDCIATLNNSLPTTTSRCQLIGDAILNYKAGDVFKVRLLTSDNTATAIATNRRTLLILEKI